MSKYPTTFFLLSFCLFCCAALSKPVATKNSYDCKFSLNGTTISLASLDKPGGYVIPILDIFQMNVNICNEAKNPDPSLCLITGAAYEYTKPYNACYPLGQAINPTISYDKNYDWVVVNHPAISDEDGMKRELNVYIRCDEKAPIRPEIQFYGFSRKGNEITSYEFGGFSSYVCSGLH